MTDSIENLPGLWEDINRAGGIDAYINQELRNRGVLVERQSVEGMSKKELGAYKKSLKEEARVKKELKKKTWLAYKSSHIVHLGEGIFWNDDLDFDKFDLPDAEKRALENELPVLEKPLMLARSLELSVRELRTLTYHREAAEYINYHIFSIPKRNGKERSIKAPRPRLKKAQRWVLREILEHIPVHGSAHGFLPDRSIHTNAGPHTNSRLVLRVDLKDFFPTITYPRVKGVFRKAGYREQIATLLALLCTEPPRKVVEEKGKTYYVSLGPRSLPQGAPTSPTLTNIVCFRMDRRLTGLARKYGWRYTRYADDFTFSLPANHPGKPNLGLLLGTIRQIAESEGFRINRDKTRLARPGSRQQITGLVVNGADSPRVPRKLKRQIRAAIHNAGQGKGFKNGDTYNKMKGYASYIHMTDPELGAKLLEELSGLPDNVKTNADQPADTEKR